MIIIFMMPMYCSWLGTEYVGLEMACNLHGFWANWAKTQLSKKTRLLLFLIGEK